MSKLPDRSHVEADWRGAWFKREGGESLTSEESELLRRADLKLPLVEGPWLLELRSPEEVAARSPQTGRCETGIKRIKWNPGMSDEESAHIVRHELGHAKYTKTWGEPHILGVPGDDPKGSVLNTLLDELMADYYSLSIYPDDELAKEHIREWKDHAYSEGGIWTSDISSLDETARNRVGYTGREIKWSP